MRFYHKRWPVFYEDNHLLVVYKPAGLITQPDSKNRHNLLDLAKLWVKKRYEKPGNVFIGMVHRLDGPVAGVVVLARTSKAASRLSAQIRGRKVDKRYLAVVEGRPPRDEDRLAHFLTREGKYSRVHDKERANCHKAVLSYRLLDSKKGLSLLEISLETGRRHQIRAQLSHIGCSIFGDKNYGAQSTLPFGCIALLAHKLSFEHPTLKKTMGFEAPIPIGWPWPENQGPEKDRPLWAVEEYKTDGLNFDG